MRIHILAENRAKRRGILAEHGLSMLIEHENINLLFDTAQSDVFVHNAEFMGVDLDDIDGIIFSHGHYDHCGGLVHFPKAGSLPPIYIHPDAFAKRYAANPGANSFREIGIEWKTDEYARNIVWNHKDLEIRPGISLISDIPFSTSFEDPPQQFYIKEGEEMKNDTVGDEQMLVIERKEGLSVFLGCSHRGVINFLKHARSVLGDRPIYSLVAGMHLEGAGLKRLDQTITSINELGIQKVVPLHCTGIEEICEIKRALGDRCLLQCAGDSFEL